MILINSGDEDIVFATEQTLLFIPSAKKMVNVKSNEENMIDDISKINLKRMNVQVYKIER